MNRPLHEHPVCFDVDQTIIYWDPENHPDAPTMEVVTPWGTKTTLGINTWIVERIRQHHVQGHFIIIWSHGGGSWARTVLETLGIEHMATLMISKPGIMYDDTLPNEWTTVVKP